MNNFYKLLFLLVILVSGCKLREIDNKVDSQSIDSLNMNIYSNEGKKILSIKSPNSAYDKVNNNFKLKENTIYLFNNNNNKEYIINSDNAKLSNNTFVELNGNVIAKTISKEDDILSSNKFSWNINNSEYFLYGNVIFTNKNITLTSNKAILNKDNNIIKFFKPVKYLIKDGDNKSGYEVNSEYAYYNIETKALNFSSVEERVRSKLSF